MKRFLILALVCLMLLPVLAACGNKTTPPATTTEKKTEAKTDAPKDDKKDGCSSSIAELAFLTPVLAGFALLKKKKKSDN